MNSKASLDQVSVREIMDTCTNTIGKVGKVNKAKRDLNRIRDEKWMTDDAMDKLKELFEEYCD